MTSTTGDASHPEHEALLADSVGSALLAVLDALAPAERLAFVLHDLFAVPFDEIAPIVGRSPAAARQLARRARRRVHGAAPDPDGDVTRWRAVVDAFLAASREGDFDALLALLDPDVVLRADSAAVQAGASGEVRGALRTSPAPSRGAPDSRSRGSLTVQRARCGPRADDHASCSASRLKTGRSSRSSCSPTPPACAGSTWRSSATDAAALPLSGSGRRRGLPGSWHRDTPSGVALAAAAERPFWPLAGCP